MRILIGNDHAGLILKNKLMQYLKKQNYDIVDVGCYDENPVDYSDIVAKALENKFDKAILICGTGVGMSIAANRHKDIRACLAESTEVAHLSRLHNDANMLCMGARIITARKAKKIVDIFLNTEFSNEPRHISRIKKLS